MNDFNAEVNMVGTGNEKTRKEDHVVSIVGTFFKRLRDLKCNRLGSRNVMSGYVLSV